MLTSLNNVMLSSGGQSSSILILVGILVAAAVFVYFLRKTIKKVDAENASTSAPVVAETSTQAPVVTTSQQTQIVEVNEEEAAAIAMALYLYKMELHDKESFRITMQKVSRIYSPWSSKIYTLRQIPNRR